MPKGMQQLLARRFGFRKFGFLSSFDIRHSDFGQYSALADFRLASLRRFSTLRFATQTMASRARVGIFFGTGPFACVWLFCGALMIHSADSAPPVAADKTDLESGPLVLPNFQEQQEIVRQAIEQTRREAEAAVKRNADTLAARLDLIGET